MTLTQHNWCLLIYLYDNWTQLKLRIFRVNLFSNIDSELVRYLRKYSLITLTFLFPHFFIICCSISANGISQCHATFLNTHANEPFGHFCSHSMYFTIWANQLQFVVSCMRNIILCILVLKLNGNIIYNPCWSMLT